MTARSQGRRGLDLKTDLHLLRQYRGASGPFKAAIIEGTAHICLDHTEAMDGMDGRDLKNMVFSRVPCEELAKIMETAPPELKGKSIDKLLEADQRGRDGTRRPSREAAPGAQRSSRPTGSRNRNTRQGSRRRDPGK